MHDRDVNAAINIKKFALLKQNSGSVRPGVLQNVNTPVCKSGECL